jgi:eukaryotic translation initiation factor 2C
VSQIISDFSHFMRDLLWDWYVLNGNMFPKNVLYYRDGVSMSQYAAVCTEELDQVAKAFVDVAERAKVAKVPDFKLTAVIVTKRHSTRFFPTKAGDAQNNNGNTKPGTLVDSVVTNPYFTDFYLQSHNGIKGTARPAHYFVLRNEMAMTTEQLEDLVSFPITLFTT